MFRFAVAQMRTHANRLVAALVAIAIATAFTVAAIVGLDAGTRTIRASMVSEYAQADYVASYMDPNDKWPISWTVTRPDGTTMASDVAIADAVTSLDQVRVATPMVSLNATVMSSDRAVSASVVPPVADPALDAYPLTDGVEPTDPLEVALGSSVASRLHANIGDQVTLAWYAVPPEARGQGYEVPSWITDDTRTGRFSATFTVTGLFDDAVPSIASAVPGVRGAAGIFAGSWEEISIQDSGDIAIVLDEGADPGVARDAIVHAIDQVAADSPEAAQLEGVAEVATPQQRAAVRMSMFFGSQAVILAILFVFAAIALAVAGLVIANTFQVLIAQRARTLALLRLVGASSKQIHRSVVIEGLLTGVIGSIAGIVLGTGLVQIALFAAARIYPSVPVPGAVSLSWPAVVLPLVTGVGVSALASLAPARRATTTSPIAALRPLTAPTVHQSAGKARLVFALIGVIGGALILATALVVAMVYAPDLDTTGDAGAWAYGGMLMLGVVAAIALVIGTILAGPFWIPKVVRGFSALLGRTGPGARVAAANTVRNPRRTSATAGALVIGVTLVAAVSAGSASMEKSLEAALTRDWAADFQINTGWHVSDRAIRSDISPSEYGQALSEALMPLPAGAAMALGDTDGVGETVEYAGSLIAVTADSPGSETPPSQFDVLTYGVDPQGFAKVAPNKQDAEWLASGGLLVLTSVWDSMPLDYPNGATVQLSGPSGSRQVAVRRTSMPGSQGAALVDRKVLDAIVPATSVDQVAAPLAPGADAVAVTDRATSALSAFLDEFGNPVSLTGTAVQRAQIAKVISVILLVVMALLAVAVLIAVIGVANTLSLSVVERTREHGLLRALGLTRGQMRWMLALEGMSVSGIGAGIGLVLGTGLGLAGAYLLASVTGDARLALYPGQIAVLFVGAILAGLVASALPGRRASRTAPAAALAME
ncbi:MAG: FtsX-like permease family protein [Bifidobacteriaceae bacterium]|jgi:putative ABC transport system permease protein|nr:FtsX-like permease family protein [Bifidobacteriaceae bacterium]